MNDNRNQRIPKEIITRRRPGAKGTKRRLTLCHPLPSSSVNWVCSGWRLTSPSYKRNRTMNKLRRRIFH
ncbi:Disease resistance protein, partial [Sesbania bispinosa]